MLQPLTSHCSWKPLSGKASEGERLSSWALAARLGTLPWAISSSSASASRIRSCACSSTPSSRQLCSLTVLHSQSQIAEEMGVIIPRK